MTTPAFAIPIGTHLPSDEMVEAAEKLSKIISNEMDTNASVRLLVGDDEDGQKHSAVVLDSDLAKLMLQILGHLRKGEGVTFVPISKRMTTQQAADILNVSRPYFVKLLEAGVMAHEKIGRHRRVLAKDLFEYKRKRDEERAAALDELFEMDGEIY